MIDNRFLFRVVDYMLARPRLKSDPFEVDRAESLVELGIVSDGFWCC